MAAYDCNAPPPGQPTGQCSACSNGATDCGPNTSDFREIRQGLDRANSILRPLGVQFYVSRIEKYKMPIFWEGSDHTTKIPWTNAALRAELKLIYPSLTDSTFSLTNPVDQRIEGHWLQAAAIRVGEPREIVVFLSEYTNGFDGRRPWLGGSALVGDRYIWQIPFKLAHELGHIVGLEHTMAPAASKDPEKQSDFDWADKAAYWDLYFGINAQGQNVYFTDRASASVYGDGGLFPKHTWDPDGTTQNCSMDANCTLKCCVNGVMNHFTNTCTSGQTETIGTAGIKGLGFTFQGDNPSQGVYRRAANSMFYIAQSSACEQWGSFSESQAEQVKRIMRSDVRIDSYEVGAEYARGYTARRQLLGDYRARWGFDTLDFDGDGKYDLAVWQPPGTLSIGGVCGDGTCGPSETPASCSADCAATCGNGLCDTGETGCPKDCGRFSVRLSTTGYATTLTKEFGRAGDVPIPADYDGDGKTDMALLRRGGLTTEDPFNSGFQWIWCRSSVNPANPDCTNFGTLEWGWRDDVPLPGFEFDGNPATREIAIYRPTDTRVHWTIIGQPSHGQIYVRFVQNRLVHLHGLYDADNKTDIVVYEPGTARFFLLLSTLNWDPAQAISRWFSDALRADAIAASGAGSSAPAVRHGGVPLPAEKNGRRALRVWDPYTANWHTMWDPITSATIQTIAWGAPRDVPLAGPIDRNADGRTDLVVFRPTFNPPTVFVCSAGTLSNCNNNFSFPVNGATPRSVISAVPDLAGSNDGRGDLLIVDPDQLNWRRFHSQNFAEQSTLTLGAPGATIL